MDYNNLYNILLSSPVTPHSWLVNQLELILCRPDLNPSQSTIQIVYSFQTTEGDISALRGDAKLRIVDNVYFLLWRQYNER